jgi:hypothetical protein
MMEIVQFRGIIKQYGRFSIYQKMGQLPPTISFMP